jgi:hypothetical protein
VRIAARAGVASLIIAGAIVAVVVVWTRASDREIAVPPTPKPLPAPTPAPVPPLPPVPSHGGVCTDLDIDGDGIADRYDAVRGSCGTGGCVYDVYLVHPGTDDEPIGQIEGRCPFVPAPRRCGVPAIEARWRLGVEIAITYFRLERHTLVPYDEATYQRGALRGCPAPRR